MKRINKIWIVTIVLAFSFFAFTIPTQVFDDFLKAMQIKFERFTKELPIEKVYLHVDRPFYKPGETIWFKAYLTKGDKNLPSNISDVLYVELINPKGKVQKRLQLQVDNGFSHGDFFLQKNDPGGLYKLRAYTNWQKNFGEDFLFEKEIVVQKTIMPRLLMKLDFEKKSYGAGDKVIADFELKNLENKELTDYSFIFKVSIAGKQVLQNNAATNNEGKAKINFTLPSDLNSNDALLNVIIKYKGNFESISRSIPIVLNNIKVQFFPEGGDLVAGLSGRVAFKALNEFGKAADISGVILDSKGKEITQFSSFHMGMGAFKLSTVKNERYTAKITKPVGLKKQFKLPEAYESGYGLCVDLVTKNELHLKIQSLKRASIYVVVSAGDKIYYSEKIQLKKGAKNHRINSTTFPNGICRVTLFDTHYVEQCERLVFVGERQTLNINIETNKKTYLPGEEVKLKLKTKTNDSAAISANLSVAVVDNKLYTFADDKQDNILSYLLLSSDLKGKIEEPHFYFKQDEPKAAKALDYVLMTQGWRHFSWKQLVETNPVIKYKADKLNSIKGRIYNWKTNKGVEAIIWAFEQNGNKRATQFKSAKNGSFVLKNLDPNVQVQLVASCKTHPAKNLRFNIERNNYYRANYYENSRTEVPTLIKTGEKVDKTETSNLKIRKQNAISDEKIASGNAPDVNVSMTSDDVGLDEVVVTGYGISREKKALGYSVAIVDYEIIDENAFDALRGKVAGVEITGASVSPGSNPYLTIRGISSYGNQNTPLFIVDGVEMAEDVNSLELFEGINAEDIASIYVSKPGIASSLYGSRALNGVIYISTKKNSLTSRPRQSKYLSTYVSYYFPYTPVREFYVPVKNTANKKQRDDFRSTIYWKHNVVTNKNGEAEISFTNSDAVSSFKVVAEGISMSGNIGRTEYEYNTQLPISISTKLPDFLCFDDIINIPVTIANNTEEVVSGEFRFQNSDKLKLLASVETHIEIPANGVKNIALPFLVKTIAGDGSIHMAFDYGKNKDELDKKFQVIKKGFPVTASFSGKDKDSEYQFIIENPIKGSLSGELNVYCNILGDLSSGVEGIFREPWGCFEQVSSATYPNIMALHYLKETGQSKPDLEAKALKYIKSGYKKIAAYETSMRGFEWYGKTPPHEGLTAYGLMELMDMKKVYDGVNDRLITRTKNWLLSRRTGNGNFKQNSGKYGFSAASKVVNNAYLVYALSECKINQINKEFELAYKEAMKSKDPYRLALIANAALNYNEQEKAKALLYEIDKQIESKGFNKMKIDMSIVRSYGINLQIETASLYLLALLKQNNSDFNKVQETFSFIIGSRKYGRFGATQATILALKALTEYAKIGNGNKEDIKVVLTINGKGIQKIVKSGDASIIKIDSLERYLSGKGRQNVRIQLVGSKQILPYTLNFNWTSSTPKSNNGCLVNLETKLALNKAKVGETVRLTSSISNTSKSGIPMTIALVGIPGGLSVQPWQLKELTEKNVFDFYEIFDNYVVFHYRELGPNETKTINLDLKAEIPGVYKAPASTSYLYYSDEFKDWEDGTEIEILME